MPDMTLAIEGARRIFTMLFRAPGSKTLSYYRDAAFCAGYIYERLEVLEWAISKDYPHRIDVIAAVERVKALLREEAGGIRPDKFLRDWHDDIRDGGAWRYTSQQKKEARKLAKRWSGFERVQKVFWFLNDTYHCLEVYENAGYASNICRCIRIWLNSFEISPVSFVPLSSPFITPSCASLSAML